MILEGVKGRQKVWILLFTCLWSRSINLKVCRHADVKHFLRAFQSHVYDQGLPELVLSDMGSTIVAGGNEITNFLDEFETHSYFERHNVKFLKFEQYAKGNSTLGGLVESCVKIIKLLIDKVLKHQTLDIEDFRFLVEEVQHMANKRPVAFKNALRDSIDSEVIDSITPELLVKGYHLNSLNIIPQLQIVPEEWRLDELNLNINEASEKLKKSREKLKDVYHNEFLQELIHQATNRKDKYRPVSHRPLQVGDIVLLKERYAKPSTYPMGIVKEVQTNTSGETTAARILKGKTREITYRHANSLILLIPVDEMEIEEQTALENNNEDQTESEVQSPVSDSQTQNDAENQVRTRPLRQAAIECRELLQNLIRNNSID